MSEPGPDDIEPVEHETLDRIITGTVTRRALPRARHRRLAGVERAAALERHRGLRDPLRAHRARRDGRLPPPLHPPLRSRPSRWMRGAARGPRLGGDRGPGHLVGRRPSQAPRLLRPPGDPHSPHVDHGGGWRGALRGLRTRTSGWLFIHTQRGARKRYAPDLLADPVVSFVDRTFLLLGARRARRRVRARLADRRHAHAPALTGLLWGGAVRHARPAPRDLLDQLAVPLLRAPALRHRRRVAQPRVAVAALVRRGVAQQPPRLPDLGRARPALLARSTPRPA